MPDREVNRSEAFENKNGTIACGRSSMLKRALLLRTTYTHK